MNRRLGLRTLKKRLAIEQVRHTYLTGSYAPRALHYTITTQRKHKFTFAAYHTKMSSSHRRKVTPPRSPLQQTENPCIRHHHSSRFYLSFRAGFRTGLFIASILFLFCVFNEVRCLVSSCSSFPNLSTRHISGREGTGGAVLPMDWKYRLGEHLKEGSAAAQQAIEMPQALPAVPQEADKTADRMNSWDGTLIDPFAAPLTDGKQAGNERWIDGPPETHTEASPPHLSTGLDMETMKQLDAGQPVYVDGMQVPAPPGLSRAQGLEAPQEAVQIRERAPSPSRELDRAIPSSAVSTKPKTTLPPRPTKSHSKPPLPVATSPKAPASRASKAVSGSHPPHSRATASARTKTKSNVTHGTKKTQPTPSHPPRPSHASKSSSRTRPTRSPSKSSEKVANPTRSSATRSRERDRPSIMTASPHPEALDS